MTVTVINDCHDPNARGRQEIRIAGLFGEQVKFIGVNNDLEASGNIIDAIDAATGASVIFTNVAQRNGAGKKWENGTPFGKFRYENGAGVHHVFTTIDGYTLSAACFLGMTDHVDCFDTWECARILKSEGLFPAKSIRAVCESQFRSFDFLPFAAKFVVEGGKLPTTPYREFPLLPPAIWYVDNFGNCKTTILANSRPTEKTITINGKELPFFKRLKDVPDQKLAVVVGSSGIGRKRFLEIVWQGGNAAETLKLVSGSILTV